MEEGESECRENQETEQQPSGKPAGLAVRFATEICLLQDLLAAGGEETAVGGDNPAITLATLRETFPGVA
ncbi:hypothetical protein HK104_001592, partial [Borealophlyctis nickersoniae]